MTRLKQMLVQYDKFIGPYPFPRDGLTVLEAPYPMEHQGAVSIGSINEPIWSKNTNMESLTSMIWHEVGHEWWGNNISMSDNADIWFHEGFTTYMEMLCHEAFSGRKEAMKKLFNDLPSNKEKMVGEYDVNHFKLNTVYSKGALMIHTLRNIIGDDSRFFRLMKSMQHDLARRTVNGDTIINYISRFTGLPLHPFFKQYIYYPAIPKLELQLKKEGTQQTLRYKWKADVPNFWMPVRLLLPQNATLDLKATDDWQEIPIGNIRLKDIKIDKENFYVDMPDAKNADSK
jgi:aminopeptidase N